MPQEVLLFETYRFSEDLDFTILPGGPVREEETTPIIESVLQRVYEASCISFADKPLALKTHSSGLYTSRRAFDRGGPWPEVD